MDRTYFARSVNCPSQLVFGARPCRPIDNHDDYHLPEKFRPGRRKRVVLRHILIDGCHSEQSEESGHR